MKKIFFAFCILFSISGFSQKTISADEANELIKTSKKLQIVDVRTPHEYDSSHVQNAINIDYRNTSFRDNIQILDKTKPVLVYCRSGKRSLNAMNIMIGLGFNDVYNLRGGILEFAQKQPERIKK
ncbi:MAG: rhodanese-like domain-containing protein [Bacteroidales bacterium]|nr:rhodanese-like domain-containing protein [Bacteroidales bacterium]